MQGKRRRWWPVCKALVSLAILFFLGRSFARDLSRPDLWDHPIRPGWLIPAALLYVAGLSLCALYWRWLLLHLGQRPPLAATLRAYFVGQLGKYVPGKALALLLRAALLHRGGRSRRAGGNDRLLRSAGDHGRRRSAGCGAVPGPRRQRSPISRFPRLGATLERLREERSADGPDMGILAAITVALFAVLLVPILPWIFNRLVHRLSLPFRDRSVTPPPMRLSYLLEGLLLTGITWPLFGIALALALHAVPGAGLDWDLPTLCHLTAVMALAYVAGFVVLIAPGALGIREAFLALLLVPILAARHHLEPAAARGKVLLAVLLLRLAWTTAELLVPLGFWLVDARSWMERSKAAEPEVMRSG